MGPDVAGTEGRPATQRARGVNTWKKVTYAPRSKVLLEDRWVAAGRVWLRAGTWGVERGAGAREARAGGGASSPQAGKGTAAHGGAPSRCGGPLGPRQVWGPRPTEEPQAGVGASSPWAGVGTSRPRAGVGATAHRGAAGRCGDIMVQTGSEPSSPGAALCAPELDCEGHTGRSIFRMSRLVLLVGISGLEETQWGSGCGVAPSCPGRAAVQQRRLAPLGGGRRS